MVLVGAPGDDLINDYDTFGSAYIFRRDGEGWIEEQKLTASDGESDDHFGSAVSLRGNLALIGAGGDDSGSPAGSAYVFRFDGTQWVEEQKLTANDGSPGDGFGHDDVSIDGDWAIISAQTHDHGELTGSAYIFHYDGSQWIEEQRLMASDAKSYEWFSYRVSISGTLAVVGTEVWTGLGRAGSAYVFRRVGSSWLEEQKLQAPLPHADDHFGNRVSVSGDVVAIGSPDGTQIGAPGSVYIYRYDGTQWALESELSYGGYPWPDIGGAEVRGGFSQEVALDGSRLAVMGWEYSAAPPEEVAPFLYIFENDHSDWPLVRQLGGLGSIGDIALDGHRVIYGNTAANQHRGAAYVLDYTSTAIDDEAQSPTSITLSQNYPNPFIPSTRIHFSLPFSGQIRIVVYDVLGREVDRLLEGHFPTGEHNVTWEAGHLPSGVYLYRLITEYGAKSHRALLLR